MQLHNNYHVSTNTEELRKLVNNSDTKMGTKLCRWEHCNWMLPWRTVQKCFTICTWITVSLLSCFRLWLFLTIGRF